MKYLTREIEKQIINNLEPNKVIVMLGARRIGKTILLSQLIKKIDESYLLLNGEDYTTYELLERRSVANYQNLLGDRKLLIIDEAQKIPDIGKILKLMVDKIKKIKIIVTGSSAFNLSSSTGEPLTGRQKIFKLLPLSEKEFQQIESPTERRDKLEERLVYGNYPELIQIYTREKKADYLRELVNSYLLKDILAFENIKNSTKILNLLRLIAFQIGRDVSYNEIGTQLQMNKGTVNKYLDLLTKVFILYKVEGFSRNLRKEITKNSRWYFYDNGIRNMVIANMNPLNIRNDVGQLWENYIISERLKFQRYNRMIVNNFFWRTYDQQEIDWVEERGGNLYGFEFKWNIKKQPKQPIGWKNAYPESKFEVINVENYRQWLSK